MTTDPQDNMNTTPEDDIASDQQKIENIINNYKSNPRGRNITKEESEKRLRELILYIVQQSEDDPHFDTEKLKLILYHIDMRAYRDTGESITGSIYIKEPNQNQDTDKKE